VFPARALCPRCPSGSWRTQVLSEGMVEEATEHRGIPIASVRSTQGPIVLVRTSASIGTRVRLGVKDGAPVAEPDR
jgi:uncharacterized OB-fold protein